jgi:hypothetical protein
MGNVSSWTESTHRPGKAINASRLPGSVNTFVSNRAT